MKGESEERHKKLEISRDTMLRAVGHVILRIFYVTVSVYWVTIHKPRNRYIRRRRVPLAEVYWQISSCCPQDFDEQNIQVGPETTLTWLPGLGCMATLTILSHERRPPPP